MPSSIIWILFLIVSKPNVCQGQSYPFYCSILKQQVFFTDKVNGFFPNISFIFFATLYSTCSTFKSLELFSTDWGEILVKVAEFACWEMGKNLL